MNQTNGKISAKPAVVWCNKGLVATRLNPNLDCGGSTDQGRDSPIGGPRGGGWIIV